MVDSTTALTCGIYLRLSRDDGRSGEANSIQGQRDDCRAYATQRGWSIREYVDEDVSASKGLDRPSYMAMLADMDSGELSVILAAKQDRFTRDRDYEFSILKAAAAVSGVAVHTVDTGDLRLGTPDGALSAGIRSEFAAFEALMIGTRTRRGLMTRRQNGEWTSSGRTFGYLKGGVLNAAQAGHIRWAYDAILKEGKTPRDVFDSWISRGITTVNGNQWTSVSRVHACLLNPALSGRVFYRGQYLRDGVWERIVTPDEQDRLRAVVSARATSARGHGARTPRRRHLAGLVLCGNPSCHFKVMNSQNPGNGRSYYWHCDRRRAGCGNRLHGPWLDAMTVTAAGHMLTHLSAPTIDVAVVDSDELRTVEAELASIQEAVATGSMRFIVAQPMLRALDARASALHVQAQQAAAQQERQDRWHDTQLTSLTDHEASAYRALLDSIIINVDGERIVFNGHNSSSVILKHRIDDGLSYWEFDFSNAASKKAPINQV